MEKYLEILRAFEACGGKGIIYGGCLRDIMCHVGPIKDIDIAVDCTTANAGAMGRFADEYATRKRVQQIGDYGNYPDVLLSIALETTLGFDVNFVTLSADSITKQYVAERCDFGICQIALDGGGLLTTPAFDKDFVEKRFTYVREPFDQHQLDRSLRRWERFQEKFKGWTLVVPEAPHLG